VRGDDGDSHRVATETATHAGCPARTGSAVDGLGVLGPVRGVVAVDGRPVGGEDVERVGVGSGPTVVVGVADVGPVPDVGLVADVGPVVEVGLVAPGVVVAHPDTATRELTAAATSLLMTRLRTPGAVSTSPACRWCRSDGSAGGPRVAATTPRPTAVERCGGARPREGPGPRRLGRRQCPRQPAGSAW
jgi:hypothetical protein